MVGYATNGSEVRRAFLYEGTLINLNTLIPDGSGWDLTEGYGVNNAGLIVGKGNYQRANARLPPHTHHRRGDLHILDLSSQPR